MWCLSLLRISHNNSMNNFLPDMIISVTEVIVPSSTKSLCSLTPETNHWSRVVDSILESAASFPAFQCYSIPSFLLDTQLMHHTDHNAKVQQSIQQHDYQKRTQGDRVPGWVPNNGEMVTDEVSIPKEKGSFPNGKDGLQVILIGSVEKVFMPWTKLPSQELTLVHKPGLCALAGASHEESGISHLSH